MSTKDKLVVRDLPYWVTKQTLESWITTHSSTASHAQKFTLVRLKKGKPANRQKNRPAIPAWAIFSCAEPKLAANLASAFDGVTLPVPDELAGGVSSSPNVEYCPLQSKAIPAPTPAEDDDICGTIFTDDKFLSFVAKLNTGIARSGPLEAASISTEVSSPLTSASSTTADKVKELIRLAEEKAAQRISVSSAGNDKLIRGIVKKVKAKAKLKKDMKITKAPTSGERKLKREEEKKRKREEKEKLIQLIERKRELKREQKEQKAKIAAQASANVAASKAPGTSSTGGSKFTVSSSRQGCGTNKPPTAKDLRMMPTLPGDNTPPWIISEPEAPPQVSAAPVILKRKQPPSAPTAPLKGDKATENPPSPQPRSVQRAENEPRTSNETEKKIGKATLKVNSKSSRPIPMPIGDTPEDGKKSRQVTAPPPPEPLGEAENQSRHPKHHGKGDNNQKHTDPHANDGSTKNHRKNNKPQE